MKNMKTPKQNYTPEFRISRKKWTWKNIYVSFFHHSTIGYLLQGTQKRKKKQERENIVKKCVVSLIFPKKRILLGNSRRRKKNIIKIVITLITLPHIRREFLCTYIRILLYFFLLLNFQYFSERK